MKKIVLFVVISLFVLIVAGCTGAKKESSEGSTPLEEEITSTDALMTAKEGYAAAEKTIRKVAPDAVFVGVGGDADADGKSEQWGYLFDSLDKSKGYTVFNGFVNEQEFSFQDKVDKWVDSSVATKVCGAGQIALGNNVWIVAAGKTICEVDGVTGQKVEES